MGIAIAIFSLGCPAPLPIPPPPPPRVAPVAPPPEPPPCDRIVRIEVRKAARVLTAHCDGGRVVNMIAALGREKTGHKRVVGDERTPEGGYRVVGPLEPSKYHGFVPIDYPSQADADAALAEGRITPADHARISRAHAEGRLPPSDTPLGGDIGIHGEGRRWAGDSRHLDWTFGCVAVTDVDLDFLAARLAIGVPVEIFP